MKTIKIRFILSLLLLATGFSQNKDYKYKQAIENPDDLWHRILVPDDFFERTESDLNDIRIFGVTSSQDTIEAPYLLEESADELTVVEIPYKLFNISQKGSHYYYSFKINSSEFINQIQIDFKQVNYDWRINLEGSDNLSDWFKILNEYRIISIYNNINHYQFNQLIFPAANYQYYRLSIPAKEKPEIDKLSVKKRNKSDGLFHLKPSRIRKNLIKKNEGIQEIIIDLERPFAICRVDIRIAVNYDYYRPISIQFLADSQRTEGALIENYYELNSGFLSSLEHNEFRFPSRVIKTMKLRIQHDQNQPLTIDSINLYAYEYSLIARFNQTAEYALHYGKTNDQKAVYDIAQFRDKIPKSPRLLTVSPIRVNRQSELTQSSDFFFNEVWLWSVMFLIMFILGYFSFKMLSKKNSEQN